VTHDTGQAVALPGCARGPQRHRLPIMMSVVDSGPGVSITCVSTPRTRLSTPSITNLSRWPARTRWGR